MASSPRALQAAAAAALAAAFGPGERCAVAAAPGRCTVVGEHVDYADGAVLAVGVDRHVAVAARPSADGRWRMVSGERRVERTGPEPCGDAADRALAVVVALRRTGITVPPVELGLAASLPVGGGLSSSAALSCAVAVALVRMVGARLPAAALAAVALAAERDVAGIPCGPLDQRVVVGARRGAALLVDCARGGGDTVVPWTLERVALVVCTTAEAHDVGGAGYGERRAQARAALRALGVRSYRELDPTAVAAAGLPAPLAARARHIVTETARVFAAVAALRHGDAARLGVLMTASGESLRVDYEVTTPQLDACVAAALAVPGCLGARMVGGGFGGSVLAIARADATAACRAAMRAAGREAWVLHLAPGVAQSAPDVIAA